MRSTPASRVDSAYLVRSREKAASSLTVEHLKGLLGLFHGLYWLHWTTHWQTQGDPSYGDHLLFERLYQALVDEIDTLAEKLVQMGGREAVNIAEHVPVMGAWLGRWMPEQDLIGRALGAERDFQAAVRQVYDDLKEEGGLSLGMDDFLMNVANTHETHLYLLQQRMGGILNREGKVAVLDGKGQPDMSAEGHFFDRPRSREVREFAQSGALTNDTGIAGAAYHAGEGDRKLQRAVKNSPLTVDEILDETPGSKDFSLLSRYLVQTEQPTDPGVPQSHDDIPKHPDIK